MLELASHPIRRRVLLHRPNIFSSFLYGILLGCISASILYFVDFTIDLSKALPVVTQPKLDQFEIIEIAIASIFFTPVFETLFFHVLVFELIGIETQTKLRKAVILSTLLFSSAHYIYGGFEHAGRMILLGGLLSLGYAWARGRSLPSALCLTLSAHTTHNSIIIYLLFYS